jgi:uncharacterized protein DUF6152
MSNAIHGVLRAWIGALALLLTLSAAAHHSTAMYDMQKTVTLKGTVKTFHWENPHCWIQLMVAGANDDEEWNVQLGPPTKLYRDDWKPLMFKPGDSIVALVHPMRDGSRRGLWISNTNTGVDGKPDMADLPGAGSGTSR